MTNTPKTSPSPLDLFLQEVRAEVQRARASFPDPLGSMAALTEEVGELAKALLDQESYEVRSEAVQVACMAARVALEGDPSLDPIRAMRKAGSHPRGEAPQEPSTRKVVYISHCLSGDRQKNRREALEWVSWAGRLGFAPSATWVALAEVWDEVTGREIGLQIDYAHVERADLMFQCGPKLSGGMLLEEYHAAKHRVEVFNFVGMNREEARNELVAFGVLP